MKRRRGTKPCLRGWCEICLVPPGSCLGVLSPVIPGSWLRHDTVAPPCGSHSQECCPLSLLAHSWLMHDTTALPPRTLLHPPSQFWRPGHPRGPLQFSLDQSRVGRAGSLRGPPARTLPAPSSFWWSQEFLACGHITLPVVTWPLLFCLHNVPLPPCCKDTGDGTRRPRTIPGTSPT